jgi:MFS transporter, FSR family, fosmidomycin resistance protein
VSLHRLKGRVRCPNLLSSQARLILILLAIECLDEVFDGARMVALPLMQSELQLSYTQIGLFSTIPNLVSTVAEPLLGIWGDTNHRKTLVIAGGFALSLATAIVAASQVWWMLLLGLALFHPASGAFVSLSQATLMDSNPAQHQQNMARWVVAGSVGALAGTLAVSATVALRWGWRGVFVGIAVIALGLVQQLRSCSFPNPQTEAASEQEAGEPISFWLRVQKALSLLRDGTVWRWLILLELADLMLDVFTGLLPLYLVAIGQLNEAQAGIVVTGCIALGLIGDFLLIPLLERVPSLRYLRFSALLVLLLFPAFLLTPNLAMKLALLIPLSLSRTGWYAILKGHLYSALPGQSSAVMLLGTIAGQLMAVVPVALGVIADRYGLDIALWGLLLAPIALLIGGRRRVGG